MPVAKTYAKMEIKGEPFHENGRIYVYVLAPKGEKKVRWYTDAEYRRMYPNEPAVHNIMDFNAKHVFGFEKTGYITLYKGMGVEEWANEDRTNIRFNLTFGFYTPGQLELPHLNNGIEPVRLMWTEIMDHDDRMKPHTEVQKIVAAKLGNTSKSKFIGVENAWIEKTVTVKENKTRQDHFGEKHMHTLVDSEGNTYIWETGAKNLVHGETVNLKMKVKKHEEINGEKVTIVWYCKVI